MDTKLFKEITGGLFMAMVFLVAGGWFLSVNRPAGLLTLLMGIVVMIFIVSALISVPSSRSRRTPSPD